MIIACFDREMVPGDKAFVATDTGGNRLNEPQPVCIVRRATREEYMELYLETLCKFGVMPPRNAVYYEVTTD